MDQTPLRDAGALAEAIVDTMRDPLLVLDGGLRVVQAGREFYRTFGVAPAETEGRLVYELGNGQWHIPRLRTLLEDVLPRETTFRDFEVEHTFEGIGRRVMLLNARAVYRDPAADPLILLVIEDVTARRDAEVARRDAEVARRDAEVRFTEMVQNVRDHSIFLTNPDGVITSWSVAAERILGYTAGEAVGKPFALIFTPEDAADGVPEEELRQAREVGRAEDERWHRRKDGSLFWALGIVTPLRAPDGSLTGFSKILRDITDRKRLEEDLRRAHGDLERRVADRTAELSATQERALRAERLAAIGQTVTTLAHEGRNALQRAVGTLEMLRWKVESQADAADLVGRTRRALDDLNRLFDDVRAYAAPIHLALGAVDIGRVWRNAWERVVEQHPDRDARLDEEVGDADLSCQADPFRLAQVFQNLFDNALEACPGPVRVTVTGAGATLNGRPAVRVSVADNGPGFAAGDSRKALEPFFTTKPKGTGLGLAIVKRLVEAHGGTVEIAEPNGGGRSSR